MFPAITTCDTSLREHELRVAQAERGWQAEIAARAADRRVVTPAAAERQEPQPDPLGVVLAKILNGGAFAVITGWVARLTHARGASSGMTDRPDEQRSVPHGAGQPSNAVVFAGARVIGALLASDRYPILAVIDRARNDGRPAFAEDADAARLEQLARTMTEQCWSEMAWVTGFVPARAFDVVCDVLERERTAVVSFGTKQTGLGTAA